MNRAFLPALTGLRGAAAIWVVLYHGMGTAFGTEPVLLRMGYVGVDVFFVLSGFILAHVHLDDFAKPSAPAIRSFIILRLSRIYPVHFVMLVVTAVYAMALSLAGMPIQESPRFHPAAFIANLGLVGAWGWLDHGTFNVVSWSISVEFLMYLLFPLLACAALRLSPRAAFAAGIALLVAQLLLMHHLQPSAMDLSSTYAPLRIAGEFCCGIGLYAMYRTATWPKLNWGLCTDLVALAILTCVTLELFLPTIALVPALIWGLAHAQGYVATVLSSRTMLFLGSVSYSLYMVHMLVFEMIFAPLNLTRLASSGMELRAVLLVAGLGAIAGATMLMYRWVEVPGRNWIRERVGRTGQMFSIRT